MKNIYNVLPPILQDAAVSVVGWKQKQRRYDERFNRKFEGYIERDKQSVDAMLAFQRKQIEFALEQASRTVYYSQIFQKLGAHWSELCSPENFTKIPLTYKSDVANNPSAFMPRNFLKGDIKIATSGTTGQSLSFNASQSFDSEQWAVWWRFRNSFGIKPGIKCALFSSTPIVPPQERNRFWRLNIAYNEYRFSVFHISDKTVKSYVASLNKIKAPWIHGNPSALALLARLILKNNYKITYTPTWLSIGSENMLPWQLETITKVFGVKPIQHYGLMEGVSNISECPHGRLHTDEDFAYTEYLKCDNSSEFMIVGTAFHNDAFSLIRYVTGDLATPESPHIKCDCGRNGRIVKKIDGRLTDYITLPNGERVASLAGPFHGTSGLAEAQIYQDKYGALTIRYVPSLDWDERNLKSIEYKLRDRIGHEISIQFKQVERVERTSRGKIKLVVSEYSTDGFSS